MKRKKKPLEGYKGRNHGIISPDTGNTMRVLKCKKNAAKFKRDKLCSLHDSINLLSEAEKKGIGMLHVS